MTHDESIRPLAGKRVVVTRAEGQSVELIARLREAGAVPIVFPTIEIVPLAEHSALDVALQHLQDYAWVIFTSANGVRNVFARMETLHIAAEAFAECQVAAVGPVTAALLEQHGVAVTLCPEEYVAEAILSALAQRGGVADKRILLLRVEVARAVLRDELLAAGAQVDEVPVYRTVLGTPDPAAYAELREGADIVTFTSSSTVKNFVTLLGDEAHHIARNALVACIGPITAQTARELGFQVAIVAADSTVAGLLAALENQ